MSETVDRILKWIGIIWSVVLFVVGVAFVAGGEWSNWATVKERVLVASWPNVGKSSDVEAQLRRLEARLNGISLIAHDAPESVAYGCGIPQKAESGSLVVMSGIRDGTGCGVTNVNYYKRLELRVPTAQ